MSWFGDALAAVAAEVQQMAGEDVTYVDGAQQAPIKAVPGRRRNETAILTEIAAVSEYAELDWLIAASALAAFALPPREGVKIRRTIGATTYTWEIAPSNTSKAVDWSDPDQTIYRCHSKLVSRQ